VPQSVGASSTVLALLIGAPWTLAAESVERQKHKNYRSIKAMAFFQEHCPLHQLPWAILAHDAHRHLMSANQNRQRRQAWCNCSTSWARPAQPASITDVFGPPLLTRNGGYGSEVVEGAPTPDNSRP